MQPGTLVGSYRIVGALGAGAMGEVCRVRNRKLERGINTGTVADIAVLLIGITGPPPGLGWNPNKSPLFNEFLLLQAYDAHVASPTGFEPVLPA